MFTILKCLQFPQLSTGSTLNNVIYSSCSIVPQYITTNHKDNNVKECLQKLNETTTLIEVHNNPLVEGSIENNL